MEVKAKMENLFVMPANTRVMYNGRPCYTVTEVVVESTAAECGGDHHAEFAPIKSVVETQQTIRAERRAARDENTFMLIGELDD